MDYKTTGFSRFLTALFVLFLAGLMAIHLIVPDKNFSEIENRFLQEFPEFTLETVTNGEFMTEFETYTTDQFPQRDFWVAMKSYSERLTGKQENNSVYLAEGNSLINHVDEPDKALLDKTAGYLNAMGEKNDIPVYFGLIPSAAEVWSDRLPKGAPTADEQAAIAYLYDQIVGVTTIDMYTGLTAHADEDIFYRTDHHWTSLGAYYGYEAIVSAMGMTLVSLNEYTPTLVADDFYGTIYSSSGVRWVPADSIHTYVEEDGIEVTSFFTGLPEEGKLYAPDFLEKKDKYSYFMGGNQPLAIIKIEHTDKPSVLVVRDSYSDALAPFLTENFSEIHLLDLRYFNAGVSQYVQQSGVDNVVVLYSLANFVKDTNLFKIGI